MLLRERGKGLYRSKCITSMRKEGEWRTREIGSPWRSVKREILPPFPTSHLFSKSSTSNRSLFRSNSLTTITPSVSILCFFFLFLFLYVWNSRNKQIPQEKNEANMRDPNTINPCLGKLSYELE